MLRIGILAEQSTDAEGEIACVAGVGAGLANTPERRNWQKRGHVTIGAGALSGRSFEWKAALRDFPIECFGADADLVGDELPFAFPRNAVAVPRDPGIEPLGDCFQRKNLRAQPRALKFLSDATGPDTAKLGALREQLLETGFRVYSCVGSAERNGIAMIGSGIERRFGQNRSGTRALQDQDRSIPLIPDQMDRPGHDKMQVRDGIAPMEQASAGLKVLLPGTQALQIWFDGSQHDNYHVSNVWDVARGR